MEIDDITRRRGAVISEPLRALLMRAATTHIEHDIAHDELVQYIGDHYPELATLGASTVSDPQAARAVTAVATATPQDDVFWGMCQGIATALVHREIEHRLGEEPPHLVVVPADDSEPSDEHIEAASEVLGAGGDLAAVNARLARCSPRARAWWSTHETTIEAPRPAPCAPVPPDDPEGA